MKEAYYWVPWYKELSKQIAKFADGDQADFLELVKKVEWNDDGRVVGQIEKYKTDFDPFSFIYTVANKSRVSSSKRLLRCGTFREKFYFTPVCQARFFH